MQRFSYFLGIRASCVDFIGRFIVDFQFVAIFSVICDDVRQDTIFQALYHVLSAFISLVCNGFHNAIGHFPDACKRGMQQPMIRHMIGHLEIPDEVRFGIHCRLRVVRYGKTVLALHQARVRIRERQL